MVLNPPIVALLVTSLIGAIFLLNGLHAIKKLQLFRAFRHFVISLLSLSIAGLSGMLLVANHGYRAFTREEPVATVTIVPEEKQRFSACVQFPDSSRDTFELAGDMLYIDAHILKWNPLLSVLGIHTSYELDRIGGRYTELRDEQELRRTIYPLSKNRIVNMYTLRRKLKALSPLLDAQYGSATFVTADKPSTITVMVSTSGLLVR